MNSAKPFISVIMPVRNEAEFIERSLRAVINQDYDKDKYEILVADGMSNDGTTEILNKFESKYSFLHLIQNKKNNTPSGLNLAISSAIGEIIIRVDGHCEIPSDYISKCVVLLSKIKADVIGGPINTKPNGKSYIAKGISYVTSHPFGVGNSMFRISKFSGYVDTVPFGAYRRDVFGKIGNFNENLERNQDNELCSRVLESGGRIYMTDELLVNYYNQRYLTGLLKQAFKTGMWHISTLMNNVNSFRLRHFTPFAFVTFTITLLVLSVFKSELPLIIFYFLAGIYLLFLLLSTLHISIKKGAIFVIILPVIFFSYHFAYGIGTWMGIFKLLKNSPKAKYFRFN